MATRAIGPPCLDYFSCETKPSEDNTTPLSYTWDQERYNNSYSFPGSTSSDCTAVSPVSPTSLPFSTYAYSIPAEYLAASSKQDLAFPQNKCKDWMEWEDPDLSLSASIDPSSIQLVLGPESPTLTLMDLERIPNLPDSTTVLSNGSLTFAPLQLMDNTIYQPRADFNVDQLGDRFYSNSTPLSWERTQIKHDPPPPPSATNNAQFHNQNTSYHRIPSEDAQVLDAAMPHPHSSASSISQTSSTSTAPSVPTLSHHRPSATSNQREVLSRNGKKRKNDIGAGQLTEPPVKKTAHNMIEKRYRTNLNDKIAALRDSVPELKRVAVEGEEEGDKKMNKATILSKATEYITQLECQTRMMRKENAALKARLEILECAADGTAVFSQGREGSGSRERKRGRFGQD